MGQGTAGPSAGMGTRERVREEFELPDDMVEAVRRVLDVDRELIEVEEVDSESTRQLEYDRMQWKVQMQQNTVHVYSNMQ